MLLLVLTRVADEEQKSSGDQVLGILVVLTFFMQFGAICIMAYSMIRAKAIVHEIRDTIGNVLKAVMNTDKTLASFPTYTWMFKQAAEDHFKELKEAGSSDSIPTLKPERRK